MKKKKLQCSVPTLLLAGVLCLTLAACGAKQSSDKLASDTDSAASAALPVKAMNAKRVDENPYMAKSDANIHHDGYNTDSTDEVLPLGIYPEINVSYEKTNANASPAIYFDSYGHAVVPLLGGIAIRDLNAEETKTLGYFSPKQHDGGGYVIQSSYTFLDSENRIVCPTSNNHVLMLRATDEAGNVLPEFEKVLDIDIKAAAEAALGKELTQNLLSVVFDYDGNLWFATGGFRIYPEREQQGVLGYIAHSAIEAILNGEQADLSKAVFVYGLALGEGAENGIAASKDGAVILTNQNCYLLRANNGVEAVWCTPYESVGAKVSGENDKTTGGGLAWGGGCSPSLTPELVMFTDNADTVKLLALDMKTGKIVASLPVLDDLPEGYQVAVENSAIVYDDSEGTVSTIVCNWFGAGNAGLADPNNDSSIQSYANIYDMNWLTKGNCMIAPGVERVDTVKTDSGYEMKSIWSRNDLSDTSILKLSTATGYIYGYVQDLTTGMWQYIILDFATGETVFTMDVSNKYGYNNMAIGMYAGNSGNALYCPTGAFPAGGVGHYIGYLFFPALAVALPRIAMTVKLLRTSILDEAQRDYVRTSMSRGRSRSGILYRHVLKNTLVPVLTFLAMTVADLLAGSVVIEQVFAVPGLGRLLLTSIEGRDEPVARAIVVLLAFAVILCNLLADLLARRIDPRLGSGAGGAA